MTHGNETAAERGRRLIDEAVINSPQQDLGKRRDVAFILGSQSWLSILLVWFTHMVYGNDLAFYLSYVILFLTGLAFLIVALVLTRRLRRE